MTLLNSFIDKVDTIFNFFFLFFFKNNNNKKDGDFLMRDNQ
jgi:hypothetical protein